MTSSQASTFVVLILAGAMLAFGGMAPASAQITLVLPQTTGGVDVVAHNAQQYKSAFRIGLSVDPTGMADGELRRAVDALPLKAPNGLPIEARDVTAQHGIVVGVTDPAIQPTINMVRTENGRTEMVVGFRDGEGRFVVPANTEIGTFTLEGLPVAHLATPIAKSDVSVFVDLLLDRSGSMKSVIGDVKRAASEFMMLLPGDQSVCRVTSFNQGYRRHTRAFEPCVPGLHGVGQISAGGGTDIYRPLRDVYRDAPERDDIQRLVVVISDGLGQSNLAREHVLAAKNATTFVYWLGDYEDDRLKGIADTFIHGRGDLERELSKTLGHIANAIGNQIVITIGKGATQ